MNYINYGYDPQQSLESAFTGMRLEQPHPMYESMGREGSRLPVVNSSQQTPSSADLPLMHPSSTPLTNTSSNYMVSPGINKRQGTPSSLAAGGKKGGPLVRSRSGIWGQSGLERSNNGKEVGISASSTTHGSTNNFGDISASTAGTISGSRNLMDFATQTNSSFDTTFGSLTGNSLDAQSDDKTDTAELESLKLKLQFKETQNESLENEVQLLKSIFNQGLDYKQPEFRYEKQNSHVPPLSLEVPNNLETMFKRMSKSLQKKEEELAAANQTLESLLTALSLNPTNSVTKFGRYDPEALAHKTVVRLETLTKENQEMAKMLAYGRSKETQIELQLMKRENEELKAKIMELQQRTSNSIPSSN
ncbi:related to protein MUM2 [Zygosaccharomyces bailii]|nr:related to protein MUM2 [Zygosaccharomyces bailii]